VTDSCMATNVASDKTARDRAESLRAVSAKDGVNFTAEGCQIYAQKLVDTVNDMASGTAHPKKQTASSISFAGPGRHCNHYWKGITSPVGSSKPTFFHQQHQKLRRDKQTKFSPYHRGGGGGGGGEHRGCGFPFYFNGSQNLRTQLKSGPCTVVHKKSPP